MKLHINNIVELLSLMVAIFYYPYLKGSFMKWFLPFLGFVFLGEIIANYQRTVLKEQTFQINYLIAITESIFYGYVFYKLNHRVWLRRILLFFIPVSVFGYLLSYFLFKDPLKYIFPNIIISGFCLAAISLFYLYTKFLDDDENLLVSDPGFWIAFGVTLFYSGVSISFSLYKLIMKNNLFLFGERLLNLIPQILSVILYLSISIAIILCKQKRKVLS